MAIGGSAGGGGVQFSVESVTSQVEAVAAGATDSIHFGFYRNFPGAMWGKSPISGILGAAWARMES